MEHWIMEDYMKEIVGGEAMEEIQEKKEWRNIRVKKSTLDKLKALGKKGQTYEDIIVKLLEKDVIEDRINE